MTQTNADSIPSTKNFKPALWTHDELERLHFAGSTRRLFQRPLTAAQRRTAFEAAIGHEEARDNAKEKGNSEAKWVEEVLGGLDAVTYLARSEEAKLRKDLAGAEAKVHDAKRREEMLASALGYRWDEATVHHYADDVDLTVMTVRMDSLEEISRRRMSESEEKASEKRRQIGMSFGN